MSKPAPQVDIDKDLEAVNVFISTILQKHDISFNKLIGMLKKIRKEEEILKVASSIFRERTLGILEALTKFLREEHNMRYSEIAMLLNRDNRVIWRTYHNAKKKFKDRLIADKKSVCIPVEVFSNRKLGLLENITKYLKEEIGLSNKEIAGILNRDNRTIWMSYNRAKNR